MNSVKVWWLQVCRFFRQTWTGLILARDFLVAINFFETKVKR